MTRDADIAHGRTGYRAGCRCPTCQSWADREREYQRLYKRQVRGSEQVRRRPLPPDLQLVRRIDQLPAIAAPAEWRRLLVALASADWKVPCATTDPHGWTERPTAEAEQLCADCPALRECGAYADAAHETWGIWGGVRRHARAQ